MSAGHVISTLFSEWGYLTGYSGEQYYPDSDFIHAAVYDYYITNERYSSTKYYWITYTGRVQINQNGGLRTKFVACANQY